jgi:hypothetical protein
LDKAALFLRMRLATAMGNRSPIDNRSFRYAFVRREKMDVFLSADYADLSAVLPQRGKTASVF